MAFPFAHMSPENSQITLYKNIAREHTKLAGYLEPSPDVRDFSFAIVDWDFPVGAP